MFTSQEGAYWILFTSEPVVIVLSSDRTTISGTSPFTGTMRLAYIPAEEASDTSTFSSTGLRRLIYHAGTYPIGGGVSWEFQAAKSTKNTKSNTTASVRHATLRFSFDTRNMADDDSTRPQGSDTPLLMLALPHHVPALPRNTQLSPKRFDLTYSCIKGPLTPVIGSVWNLEEPLSDFGFDTPLRDIDEGVRRTIIEQVKDDMSRVLPTNDENVYGFGKQVARLAQLAHIASELTMPESHPDVNGQQSSLTQALSDLLFSYLESFLSSKVDDFLLFDENMGGLVSINGLRDKSADFGNGR